MQATLEAIYENGVLKLAQPLPLPDRALVRVSIQADTQPVSDSERTAWLKMSEAALNQTWDNPADDVFNELL